MDFTISDGMNSYYFLDGSYGNSMYYRRFNLINGLQAHREDDEKNIGNVMKHMEQDKFEFNTWLKRPTEIEERFPSNMKLINI